MIRELDAMAREIAWEVPGDLAAVAGRLEQSTWPDVVDRWSQLTPGGFPIELTVSSTGSVRRWVTEVVGPEVHDSRRLGLVAEHLAAVGQAIDPFLLLQLERLQCSASLRFGAWLGGRSDNGVPCYKLYAEVPHDVACDPSVLPASLCAVAKHAPQVARASIVGIEPARGRVELYFRLPALDPDDLRPVLHASGYSQGLETIDRCLPDGRRRLEGRALGLSVAVDRGPQTEITLYMAARSVFPGSPEMLSTLIPAISEHPLRVSRPTLVAMRLTAGSASLALAVGLTVARPN